MTEERPRRPFREMELPAMTDVIFTATQRLSVRLDSLEISKPTKAALAGAGLKTVADFLDTRDPWALKGIKSGRVQEIRNGIAKIGVPVNLARKPGETLLELVSFLAKQQGLEEGQTCVVKIGFGSSWRDVLEASIEGFTHAQIGWVRDEQPMAPAGLVDKKIYLPLKDATRFLLKEMRPQSHSAYTSWNEQEWVGEVQLREYRSSNNPREAGNDVVTCTIRDAKIKTKHVDYSEDGEGQITFHPRQVVWPEPDPPT